jgi:hypothetical protein
LGKLIYGAPMWSVDFDDRTLAHLRIVILAKLRRSESFSFSWRYETGHGTSRSSLWMHPSVPLQFEFFGGREPSINRAWIDALMLTANTPNGLELMPEPVAKAPEKG